MQWGASEQLLERVVWVLQTQGPQSAAQLARAVAGATASSASAFGRILASRLATDLRFRQDDTGSWQLASCATGATTETASPSEVATSQACEATSEDAGSVWPELPPLPELVVALHVETTGGRGERPRLVQIGAVRLCQGQVEAVREWLINPQIRIPKHIWQRLGLEPDHLDQALLAPQVLQEVRDFVGDAVLAGQQVLVHIGQLNYEALWHGLPAFTNACLDVQTLAAEALPALNRPGLIQIAQALGVPRPRSATAGTTAHLVVQVLTRLLPHQATPTPSTPSAPGTAGVAYLRGDPPGSGAALPEAPGVYRFLDADGKVLYVGKATNLRQRVTQHFSGAARLARMDDGLLARTARVEHEPTGNELEALLLESALIRRHTPPYNTQRRVHRGAVFIRLESGPFPRAATVPTIAAVEGERVTRPAFSPDQPSQMCQAPPVTWFEAPDGSVYFGPYRTARAAHQTLEVVQRVFQVRDCTRVLPARRKAMRVPCLRLGQGRCPAPCAGAISPAAYGELIALARVFLAEGRDAALAAVEAQLADRECLALPSGPAPGPVQTAPVDPASEAEASHVSLAQLREVRVRLMRVRHEERPLPGGFAGGRLVMVYPDSDGCLRAYLVRDGRLIGKPYVDDFWDGWGGAYPVAPEQWEIPDESFPSLDVDQTNLLLRWVHQHYGEPDVWAL